MIFIFNFSMNVLFSLPIIKVKDMHHSFTCDYLRGMQRTYIWVSRLLRQKHSKLINSEKLKSKYEINFFYWKHCGKKKLLPCNSCFFKLFFPFQEHCTKQAHIWNESSSPFIHTESTQILRHCWLELHLTRFWPKDHFLGQILDYNSQIWSKFEPNCIKKAFLLIRTAPFYLLGYGS